MSQQEADGNSAISQPRCEVMKETLLVEGECEMPGEVRYRGLLLCGPHAALLGLEERAEALLGSVFHMDKWMEENESSNNGSAAADEEFVGRIRYERDEAQAALRLTRAQIRSARKALSIG